MSLSGLVLRHSFAILPKYRERCFRLVTNVGQREILSHHEESNLRPSDSAVRCSTSEPQSLYSQRGLLRISSYDLSSILLRPEMSIALFLKIE